MNLIVWNEVEFLKLKFSEQKWNRKPENEITCILFEIDTGMSTSNQFRCEIERPFTNLNDISTKLAGKTNIFILNTLSINGILWIFLTTC